jgi:hypothetical protein
MRMHEDVVVVVKALPGYHVHDVVVVVESVLVKKRRFEFVKRLCVCCVSVCVYVVCVYVLISDVMSSTTILSLQRMICACVCARVCTARASCGTNRTWWRQ